jgi:MEMO1 family protein
MTRPGPSKDFRAFSRRIDGMRFGPRFDKERLRAEGWDESMKTEERVVRSGIRPPACAGRFYPADATELRELVETCLKHARSVPGEVPKAIIAPHAGYIYSGPIAGSAYRPWRGAGSRIRRVVMLCPARYADFKGVALSSATGFETPLGVVPVDDDLVETVRRLPQVRVLDSAHDPEHALEVQLPFLQTLLERFSIVPLLVGAASDEEVAEVLEPLWGDAETRVVVSSDLSHYHDYLTALAVDAATARAIEHLDTGIIDGDHACGSRAIRALIGMARRHGLHARTVDLRNSGDTAGPRDRVVGYGAFVFGERNVGL